VEVVEVVEVVAVVVPGEPLVAAVVVPVSSRVAGLKQPMHVSAAAARPIQCPRFTAPTLSGRLRRRCGAGPSPRSDAPQVLRGGGWYLVRRRGLARIAPVDMPGGRRDTRTMALKMNDGGVALAVVALVLGACNASPQEPETDSSATSTSPSTTNRSGGSEGSSSDGAPTSSEPTDSGGTGDATSSTTASSADSSSGETAPATEPDPSTSTGPGTSASTGPGETGETGDDTTGAVDDSGTSTGSGETGDDTTSGTTGDGDPLWHTPNLWYSVDKSLMYIELSPADGSVVGLVHNALIVDEPLFHGQNGLTMLEGGALLGSREAAMGTQIYYVPDPPVSVDTPAQGYFLGMVPNDGQNQPIRVEALYTDCDGRVYLMDTGVDVTNSIGNRLLRFTGDYLAGDLAFEVITNLQNASVGDIDDMSPGIVNGEISDSFGFAIDSSRLWQIDYTTGTGMQLSLTSGTYGVHALGGPLFDDGEPRLYVLSAGNANTGGQLFGISLGDYASSMPLVEGPDLDLNVGVNGWSGLAGPLTECMTTIPQ